MLLCVLVSRLVAGLAGGGSGCFSPRPARPRLPPMHRALSMNSARCRSHCRLSGRSRDETLEQQRRHSTQQSRWDAHHPRWKRVTMQEKRRAMRAGFAAVAAMDPSNWRSSADGLCCCQTARALCRAKGNSGSVSAKKGEAEARAILCPLDCLCALWHLLPAMRSLSDGSAAAR